MSPQAYHLLFKIWDIPLENAEPLRLPEQGEEMLRRLVELAGMSLLREPTTVHVADEGKAWGSGVSSIGLLIDSHTTLHGLEVYGILYGDLFSCRRFDWELIGDSLQGQFGGRGRLMVIDRDSEDAIIWRRKW